MAVGRRVRLVMARTALALAVAAPVFAQGKSPDKGHKSAPPSISPLPSSAAGPAAGASPLAWLDDATLLPPGSMSLTISTMRWSGADLSEVDFPIVEAAVGLAPRFQIGASVPRVVGDADGTGRVGGMGTSYIGGKVALLTGASGVKLAVAPMLEILGEGAAQALGADESRVQFGLPVMVEIGQGPVRVFASTGFFSRGARFVGGGAGIQATPRVGVSASFTRSWTTADIAGVSRDRGELSGGVSYLVRPRIGVYGALGQTVATSDENGAGTSISGGLTMLLNARVSK